MNNETVSHTQQWDIFSQFGTRQFVKKNSVIYNQGDIGQGFYCVEKGLIRIKTCSIQGDVKNINMIGPGQLFGELSLIQAPSIGTAIASEDSTVCFIPLTKFKELISSSDTPLMMLFNSILKKMSSLVETAFLSSAEQQIAHSLLKLRELSQKKQIIIMQKDLAEYAGITRMTLNTVLKKWRNDGIIDMENKAITIMEPDVLSAYSKMNAL